MHLITIILSGSLPRPSPIEHHSASLTLSLHILSGSFPADAPVLPPFLSSRCYVAVFSTWSVFLSLNIPATMLSLVSELTCKGRQGHARTGKGGRSTGRATENGWERYGMGTKQEYGRIKNIKRERERERERERAKWLGPPRRNIKWRWGNGKWKWEGLVCNQVWGENKKKIFYSIHKFQEFFVFVLFYCVNK